MTPSTETPRKICEALQRANSELSAIAAHRTPDKKFAEETATLMEDVAGLSRPTPGCATGANQHATPDIEGVASWNAVDGIVASAAAGIDFAFTGFTRETLRKFAEEMAELCHRAPGELPSLRERLAPSPPAGDVDGLAREIDRRYMDWQHEALISAFAAAVRSLKEAYHGC